MHTAHRFARFAAGALLTLAATAAGAQQDPAVDACDNFYLHACGAFLASTQADAAHPSIELANVQFEANLERSFDTLFAAKDQASPELARVKTFYASCMANSAADGALTRQWLARVDAAQTPAQIQDLLFQLGAIGVDPFFTYIGQPDRTQPDRYRGEIHNSFLWENPQTVQRSFVDAGLTPADAVRDAAVVGAMVAALRKERGNRWDAATAENPRTLAQLTELAPSIDWRRYFTTVGAAPASSINVTAPAYLRAVERELRTRTPAELRAFLRWSFLFALRGELPAPYNAAFGDIAPSLRVQLGNPTGRCRDATVRAMGVEFSRQYATRVLGWKARDAARQIASEIKARIIAAVAHADWLSPAGQQATADKLARTDLKIGFPDQWPEVGNYPLGEQSFLANVLSARAYEQRRNWARAGTPHLRTNWDMIVSPWVGDGMAAARLVVPNGFPDALSNSIIMTAAYLAPPRFDADAPVESNYATFGAIFAHEFVHVAETHEYDAEGLERELWSAADIKAEEAQGQCVVDQANAYQPLPGLKLKGDHQYGENVADYGGLRLAFEALEARLGKEALYRPDASGISPAQRFFYGYAQNRCAAQTEDYLRKVVESDSHAPPAFRVNAPLSNLPAFGRAFSCKPDANMMRETARPCRVW